MGRFSSDCTSLASRHAARPWGQSHAHVRRQNDRRSALPDIRASGGVAEKERRKNAQPIAPLLSGR